MYTSPRQPQQLLLLGLLLVTTPCLQRHAQADTSEAQGAPATMAHEEAKVDAGAKPQVAPVVIPEVTTDKGQAERPTAETSSMGFVQKIKCAAKIAGKPQIAIGSFAHIASMVSFCLALWQGEALKRILAADNAMNFGGICLIVGYVGMLVMFLIDCVLGFLYLSFGYEEKLVTYLVRGFWPRTMGLILGYLLCHLLAWLMPGVLVGGNGLVAGVVYVLCMVAGVLICGVMVAYYYRSDTKQQVTSASDATTPTDEVTPVVDTVTATQEDIIEEDRQAVAA